jgi:hypothetical protein
MQTAGHTKAAIRVQAEAIPHPTARAHPTQQCATALGRAHPDHELKREWRPVYKREVAPSAKIRVCRDTIEHEHILGDQLVPTTLSRRTADANDISRPHLQCVVDDVDLLVPVSI